MDLVRRHLQRDYPDSVLRTEGLRIITTLAPRVQGAAERALTQRAEGWRDDTEGAVVDVDINSGEVQALVGGRDPRYAGFNRALDAQRPIGSLVKPSIYLTALMRPEQYGLGTLLPDRPVTLQNAAGEAWQPQNYDDQFLGDIPLWQALAESRNAATVHLGLDLGLRAVVDTIERLGGEVPTPVYPSLLLGAFEQSPLAVARQYHTLANQGLRTPLRAVRTVMTAGGQVRSRYSLDVERAVEAAPVYLVTKAMQRVVTQGTAHNLDRWVADTLNVAGKTGTTDGLRDSWFAGFSGDQLAVVWVGRDDNGPTGLTGSSGAMTVWGGMMQQLTPEPLRIQPPEGIEWAWVNAASGRRTARDCDGASRLPYRVGHRPQRRTACLRQRDAAAKTDDEGGWLDGWFE